MCFSSQMSFQSLCPSKRETIFLNLDLEYEYRPDHYEEVICAGRSIVEEDPFHRPVNIIFGTHRKPTTTKTILIFLPQLFRENYHRYAAKLAFHASNWIERCSWLVAFAVWGAGNRKPVLFQLAVNVCGLSTIWVIFQLIIKFVRINPPLPPPLLLYWLSCEFQRKEAERKRRIVSGLCAICFISIVVISIRSIRTIYVYLSPFLVSLTKHTPTR